MKSVVITGANGSGRTGYLLSRVEKNKNNIFITNDSSVFYIEKYFGENRVNGRVVGISSLAKIIEQDIGGICEEVVADNLQVIIISDIMIRNHSSLNVLHVTNHNNGIADDISRFINACLEEGIGPENIYSAAENFAGSEYKKMRDIAFIFDEYLRFLASKNMVNNIMYERKIAEKVLEFNGYAYDNVYVDTLNEYSPNKIALVEALAKKSRTFYVAFTIVNPKKYLFDIYKDSNEAYVKINNFLLSIEGNEIERVSLKSKMSDNGIDIIKKEFFDRDTKTVSSSENVVLHEATNIYKEVDFISSKIKELVRSGYSLDDIILTGTSLIDYINIINNSFKKNGIRSYYYKTNNFEKTSVYVFLRSVLKCYSDGFSVDEILKLIESGYLGFTNEEEVLIKKFFLRFGTDIEIALKNGEAYDNASFIVVENVIKRLKEKLAPIYEKFDSCKTYDSFINSAYEYLVENGVDSMVFEGYRQYASENPQFANWLIDGWNCFVDIVDRICLAESERECKFAEFVELFDKIANESYIRNSQEYCDEVKILDIQDAENRKSKVMFVIGCVEGEFPATYTEGLISDKEISLINNLFECKIQTTKDRLSHAYYSIYSAITSPSEKLFISWHINDTDARPLRCSILLNNVVKTFAENIVEEKKYYDTDKEELMFSLLNNLSEYRMSGKINEDTDNEYWQLLNDPNYSKRLANAIASGVVEKDVINAEEEAISYKEDSFFAVTRLEKFNQCPFKHFVEFGLTPQYQKLFEETAANKGSFYHDILNKVFTIIDEKKIDIYSMSYDDFRVIIDKVIEETLESHNENVLLSDISLIVEKDKMQRKIINSAWMAIQQIKAGAFSVLKTEFRVGRDIPLTIELEDGSKVNIIGVIDRIDEAEIDGSKYVRIIDYKSGSTTFSEEKVRLGLQLQLPVYMKSVIGDRLPAGIYYSNLSDNIKDVDNPSDNVAKKAQLNGITVEDIKILEDSDFALTGVGVTSNVIQAEITNKGEISKRSKTLKEEDFNNLIETAVSKVIETITAIRNGETKAAPKRTSDYFACEYCPYKSICHH